jgi:undecaprenyl-diphosphatase
MPDFLLNLDLHLFHFINHDMGNAFFDWLMPLMRNAKFWIPLYVFILVFCIWKYKKAGAIIIIMLALTVGAADYGSATIIKSMFKRVRPCRDPAVAPTDVCRVPCGTGFSFPSTHASDHFSIAIFLSFVFYRRWRWIWLWAILWAGIISFAQVYVGVHYPIDVTCGALFGILVGTLFAFAHRKWQPQFYLWPGKH